METEKKQKSPREVRELDRVKLLILLVWKENGAYAN